MTTNETVTSSGVKQDPAVLVDSASEIETKDTKLEIKLKAEKENWKAKALELEAREKARQEEELTKTNQFKALWESEKQDKAKILTETENLKKLLVTKEVDVTIRSELTKAGVDEKWIADAMSLVDKKIVSFDTETGTVIGADSAVKSFVEKYASLGFFKKNSVGVNHAAPATAQAGPKPLAQMTIMEKAEYLATLRRK